MDLQGYWMNHKEKVDKALQDCLPPEHTYPAVIFQAIRYSLFAGGKRIRPLLCIAAAESLGGSFDQVVSAACALEMIHTYSLIHDDLPALDNDDYRRGILTNHKVFGENVAILAGDALLTEAFHLLSHPDCLREVSAETRLALIHHISEATGFYGMVGGQVMDVLSEGKEADMDVVHYIHSRKTGALITASVYSGAALAGASPQEMTALLHYAAEVGLAFQIKDDILNVEGEQERIGKGTGTDSSRGKATYPSLVGIEASKRRLQELLEESLAAISSFDEKADPLRQFARYIVERDF
ncbi:MAG: polyprenyl synthetase family protein [Syntrophobacterales bacterium]|jgi:geranylgeranyl diphosphate synthase type II|nr:polyprenyl synthetase family protein [Syntrophobacterales bacterium]